MRNGLTRVAAGIGLAVVAIGLAACGDDTDDRAGRTTTTAAATTTASTTVPSGDVAPRPSAACATPDAQVAPGEEKVTMATAEGERWYLRHVPEGYDGERPLPLVVDFHGYSEGAEVHALHSALGPFGDEHGFVTVSPHGTGVVPLWRAAIGSPDLELFGALLDHVEASVCVDEARVYVTGLSNGAMMTSAVACQYADRIAAAAPVAGIADIDGCAPARAVPVVVFHGTEDPFLPYEGGFGRAVADLPTPDGSRRMGDTSSTSAPPDRSRRDPTVTVPDATAAWATRNGCASEPPAEEEIGADVVRLSFDCPAGAEAELYRIDGGGHTWPGSEFSKGIERIAGPTTFTISANEVMWEFFLAHPLR